MKKRKEKLFMSEKKVRGGNFEEQVTKDKNKKARNRNKKSS